MSSFFVPERLSDFLNGSSLATGTTALLDDVEVLLADNKTPFFPGFTDHGNAHMERVLAATEKLIPASVWEADLFEPADACVLICAAMLHDVALHVREPGFIELVGKDSPFQPRPWFSEAQPPREPDRPWNEIWTEFQREARHMGASEIELLFGEHGSAIPEVAYTEELDPAAWTIADRLLVGEFLRRHHARLGHEIAIYGFPGANGDIPVLAETIPNLAEAIGVLARSHGEPIRIGFDYLSYQEEGNKRPFGTLLHFHMGLLRVADYLQIEAERAPPLLMRLKALQSPRSIEEWEKHGAIASISWDNQDPQAIFINVSPSHGLRTHLALAELFADMQVEMDTTSGALSEVYGGEGTLAQLGLSRRRLRSNLDEPSLQSQLPYFPHRAALRSDKDLFRLVIKDLYGNHPEVAGRELVQNAVDAIRARRASERDSGEKSDPDELARLGADVRVRLEVSSDGDCVLSIEDCGIGMSPELIVDYFLTAGASYGPTRGELDELESEDLLRQMKAGRFGVGAFAAFLLGSAMEVKSRRLGTERGVTLTARIDQDLVQLDWADLPVGTTISIPFEPSTLKADSDEDVGGQATPKELLEAIADFYRLRDPTVSYELLSGGECTEIQGPADVPPPGKPSPQGWRTVSKTQMDSVMWAVPGRSGFRHAGLYTSGLVAHNGIVIRDLDDDYGFEETYRWSEELLKPLLGRPGLAIFDSRHRLGVALHRYRLVEWTLPFEDELLRSIGLDLVGHALTREPGCHPLQDGDLLSPVYSRTGWFPLLPALLGAYTDGTLLVLWKTEGRLMDLASAPVEDASFFAARGAPSWRRFPFRASIATDYLSPEDHDIDELRAWHLPLSVIEQEARTWGTRLDATELASIVVRGSPIDTVPGDIDKDHLQDDPFTPEWRSVSGDDFDQAGVFLRPGEQRSADIEKKLLATASELHKMGLAPTTALTLFGDLGGGGDQNAKVAEAWIKTVGAEMPRSKKARDGLRDQLAKSRSRLRPSINKWLAAKRKRC